jgi:hypothetical protein
MVKHRKVTGLTRELGPSRPTLPTMLAFRFRSTKHIAEVPEAAIQDRVPAASAVAGDRCLYAGLRPGLAPDEALAPAEAVGGPFAGSDELKA